MYDKNLTNLYSKLICLSILDYVHTSVYCNILNVEYRVNVLLMSLTATLKN